MYRCDSWMMDSQSARSVSMVRFPEIAVKSRAAMHKISAKFGDDRTKAYWVSRKNANDELSAVR